MGVLLRQAEERSDGESRPGRRWRHLDVGWDGRRQQARGVLVCRRTRQRSRDDLHGRSCPASRQSRPANQRRSQAYLEAVEGAFGGDIDYAMLVKIYGPAPEGQRRYSPAECTGALKHRIEGNPDPKHVTRRLSERQNLNIRMGNRRMTRLTNAFPKRPKTTRT